ncbi:MAG: glycosyltransferase [Butyrivibrio sp.]|nr:glycosyltransferase [Butyrivibrio sp.]
MRTLLIDVNCKGSSTGKIVYDLYSALNSGSDVVGICYGRGVPVKEPNIFKFGLDWETALHAGLSRITGYNGGFSFFSTKRLIDYIEKFKPDIIHIHELHAYFVNIKPLIEYIKKKKIPVVWTFHCEYMYTGKCGYAYECDGWKKSCGNCPAVREYPKSMFFDHTRYMFRKKKNILNGLDFTIVTPSSWLADRVKQSFLKDRVVNVIHNGIDTESIFYPRSKAETDTLKSRYMLNGRKIVLAVAPNIMEERKGGRLVLKIAEKMKNLQFVLVGSDEDAKYSDNVLMIKRTKNQDELAKWYSLANLFLICSNKENFPTTCLEALACGTPIVGIDAGGTKETAPNPYGRFVGATEEELQKAISEQLNLDNSSEEIRSVAEKLYSKQVMCEAYKRLYTEVCGL